MQPMSLSLPRSHSVSRVGWQLLLSSLPPHHRRSNPPLEDVPSTLAARRIRLYRSRNGSNSRADLNLSTLNPQHSTLNTQHSILDTQHLTPNTQHSKLITQHSTLNTQHSTLNPWAGSSSSSSGAPSPRPTRTPNALVTSSRSSKVDDFVL